MEFEFSKFIKAAFVSPDLSNGTFIKKNGWKRMITVGGGLLENHCHPRIGSHVNENSNLFFKH